MKKTVAILLILCLCPMAAWAEAAQHLDNQTIGELCHAIFEANQLETLFSRHPSLTFLLSNPDAPDGYDMIWETKEVYYQSYADWFALWEKDQVYYEMLWDDETDSFRLIAGYDYDQYYIASCYADTEEELWDSEHDHLAEMLEKDGQLILTIEYDKTLSRKSMEDLGLEYAGETVMSRMTVDAATYEVIESCKYVMEDGKEQVIHTCRIFYGQPEPMAARILRAAIERENAQQIKVTYVFDPGTEREITRTVNMPANTEFGLLCDSVPYVCFYDQEQTTISGWDGMSDLTVYYYTNPDESLIQHFKELYDAEYPQKAE